MKYNLYKYCGAALCTALALMTASCSMHDDITDDCRQPESGIGGAGKAYIQLSFGLSGVQGTRANPTGGENGDGQEAGQENENEVKSAVAFLFDGDATINSAADTPIMASVYFGNVTSQDKGKMWTTETQQADVKNGTYNVIVVANPGDENWWSTANNLGDVRDKIYKTAWTKAADGTCSDFLMALADEPAEKLEVENNPEDNPATITVDVERVAARVDYKADGDYHLTDINYSDATVTILGATIINDYNAGSYLLKRVSTNWEAKEGNGVRYLGREKIGTDGLPTNYVIDPWTSEKTSANAELAQKPFTVDGEKVNAAGLYVDGRYLYSGSENPEWWSNQIKSGTPITVPGGSEEWQLVGYTLENTTSQSNTAKTYNTGLAFKVQFNPGTSLEGYVPEHTFFRYNDRLYTSLTAMMGQLNEQSNFADYFNTTVNDLKSRTWADVTRFCDNLSYDPVGLADYFADLQGEADASASVGSGLDNVTWATFLATLGVDENDPTNPLINQDGHDDTRAMLYESSNGMLRTYYKGQCYYIWWLRHSNNNDDTTNGVMEYAIVRNNIYKVKVSSVSTIGGDVPGSEELRAHVYVNDWVALEGETLPM